MSKSLFENVFRLLGPSTVPAFYPNNTGGSIVIATNDLTKYRPFFGGTWFISPNFDPNFGENHRMMVVTPDQVTDEIFKMVLDDLKRRVQIILAGKYYLVEVGTMLGTLPVISKDPAGTHKRVPIAHLYPGAQTDALDGADIKDEDSIFEMPEEDLDHWLIAEGNKVFDLIQKAIINLERPERYISWYDKPKE
jgi:hypothetical protein